MLRRCAFSLLLATLAAGAYAASMDASNQEGVSAGKAASGTTSASPGSYFENYSADAPQQGYYGGPAQTSTDMDVKGQSELNTSDLGQSAREAYINNPADSLSHDSDMMKYSDEVRGNAEAITGLSGGQCVEQVLNKTTYTTHRCEMAVNVMKTCTRKATITGKTGTGTERVQKKIDSSSLNVIKTTNDVYAMYTVDEDATVVSSSASWSFNEGLAFGNWSWMPLIKTPLGNFAFSSASGSISLAGGVQLKKGQQLKISIFNRNGYPMQNWYLGGNMRYHFVITLNIARTVTRQVPEITWSSSCEGDMGDAVKLSETCSAAGGDRTVVMDGISYTLSSDCWEYTQNWVVNEDDTNTCQAYTANPNCSEGVRTCISKTGSYCVLQSLTYQCAHTVKSTGYVCGSEFYCSDGSCAAMQAGENQNFEEAVSQLAALAAAGEDVKGMDPESVTAFTGKALACRQSAAGFSNCCKSGGWGQDAGLAQCNTEEQEIGTGKEKKLVVKVGSYCSRKVLGVCLQKKEGYCVFDSKLARIVQEQGRRDQLHISFGDASSPDCRGIKVAELQGINFGRIDFSDFYNDLNSNVSLPDTGALTERIQSDIRNSLKSSGE